MPLVEMRRSTRVFVPKSVVKDTDGARVLRSGKRFSLDCGEEKPVRGNGDEWFCIIDDTVDVPRCKSVDWYEVDPERDDDVTDFNVKLASQESGNMNSGSNESRDKMHGIVYNRKRRRLPGNKYVSSPRDRMYGISFVRKQRRKRSSGHSINELPRKDCQEVVEDSASEVTVLGHEMSIDIVHGAILDIVVESSCNSAHRFTCFLVSILKFVKRSRISLTDFAAFMCSEPLVRVFAQHGVHFLANLSYRISRKNDLISPGICQIFEARQSIPKFSLDFCASPLTFMRLHFSVVLRSLYLPNVLIRYLSGLIKKAREITDNKKYLPCIPTEMGFPGSNSMASWSASVKKRKADFIVRATDLARRSVSTRHSANSRNVQRKRTSLRSTRARNSSSMGFHHDLFRAGYKHKKRKLAQKSPCSNVKELKSTLVELKQNMDSVCCSANILVIESDRCFREEGAKVTLECLASNDWYLVAKTHGLSRYVYKAENVMRPSTPNRFTHAMIWTGENGWKLEFSNRRDWFIFKQLHLACMDRNLQVASARTIPVPGVYEVPYYDDSGYVPFVRPMVYITMRDDEVARALVRKPANYDMDSGDEEWLEKLNNGVFDGDVGVPNYILPEKFEEMMDAFEKAAYHTPDEVSDESRATSFCSGLGRKDTVAAVYQYWMKKRKQNHVALLRVFQCPPPRRSQLMQKPVFRKKRSFKRQMRQSGRGKQQIFFHASAVEQEQDAMHRVQKAKSLADTSMESVLIKRRRAQILMDNADLATYKAAMAMKIAEAAQLAESPEAYVSFILDD